MTAAHDEQPRRRLFRRGAEALSDTELLAMLLRSGRPGTSVLAFAAQLLGEVGGLAGLVSTNGNLLRRRGVGEAKAASVLAAIEIGRRLSRVEVKTRRPLDCPSAVARYLTRRFGRPDQEVMGALYLDTAQRLIDERELFRGTLTRAAVEPRPILKDALLCRASAFVLFHTHPSGDPSPSAEDLAFTRRMVDAGEMMGIPLADHLILGVEGQWTSLRRFGCF